MCTLSQAPVEVRSLRAGATGGCELPHVGAGIELGFPGEQYVLLTAELSLQSPFKSFPF